MITIKRRDILSKKFEFEEAYGAVNLEMLEELTLTDGISGHEKEVAQVFKKWTEDSVDAFDYDELGSIIGIKEGQENEPKIMLAGHIDEIGFLVKNIDDKGFLRLHPVGGWWPHVLLSQAVTVKTREGKEFVGVVGSQAPHTLTPAVRNKVMKIDDIYVDLGVRSKEEVLALGIQIGDPITPKAEFHEMANPNYLMSKAWDDRIGAAIVIEVMRRLKEEETKATVYGVGTVQEEVGLRGAQTAAQKLNPDIGIALDVTVATDAPGEDNRIELGKGITFEVMDGSHIGHKGLIYYLQDLAEEMGKDYQFEILSAGGTDSGTMHKVHDGVIQITLSIPARYIHSHRGVIHRKDFADTVDLLVEFIKRLDQDLLLELRNTKRP